MQQVKAGKEKERNMKKKGVQEERKKMMEDIKKVSIAGLIVLETWQ